MRNIFLLICFYCGFIAAVAGQDTGNKKYQFHSIINVALLNGNNGTSAGVQSINGFAKDNWFAGIGTGLDYYLYRSVPLFMDLRYELGKKKNKFFAYGDAGINISWVKEYNNDWFTPWSSIRNNNYNNGLYTEAGIGISAAFKKGDAFLLSLGYSTKSLEEIITYDDWRTGQKQSDINKYRFRRLALKMGFRF